MLEKRIWECKEYEDGKMENTRGIRSKEDEGCWGKYRRGEDGSVRGAESGGRRWNAEGKGGCRWIESVKEDGDVGCRRGISMQMKDFDSLRVLILIM